MSWLLQQTTDRFSQSLVQQEQTAVPANSSTYQQLAIQPSVDDGALNQQSTGTAVSCCPDDWAGVLVMPVSKLAPGEIPSPYHVYVREDICQYFGTNPGAINFKDCRVYFDVVKYPPPLNGKLPSAKTGDVETQTGDSFDLLSRDLRLSAIEGGFEIVSRGVGKFCCNNSRKQCSCCLEQVPDGQLVARASACNEKCSFYFMVFCDVFGYFIKVGRGKHIHSHHLRRLKKDMKQSRRLLGHEKGVDDDTRELSRSVLEPLLQRYCNLWETLPAKEIEINKQSLKKVEEALQEAISVAEQSCAKKAKKKRKYNNMG